MTFIPAEPNVPAEQRGESPLVTRYEDIGQNGKLLLDAMPIVLGASVWGKLIQHPTSKAMRAAGIIPILSRLVLEGGQGPVSINSKLYGKGLFQSARTENADGSVDKLFVNMWCTVFGEAGRTHGPPPENAGQTLECGRVFAEHVLTKPFGPKEERRVTRIDFPGLEPIPSAMYTWRTPESTLALPEGAVFLDEHFSKDPAPVIFGIDHTDSNQHVNSLVYPRLFIEAGLRRLWDHGKRGGLIVHAAEMSYRKPSFAGERVRALLRAFTRGKNCGIVAMLVADEEAEAPLDTIRPRVFAKLYFRED